MAGWDHGQDRLLKGACRRAPLEVRKSPAKYVDAQRLGFSDAGSIPAASTNFYSEIQPLTQGAYLVNYLDYSTIPLHSLFNGFVSCVHDFLYGNVVHAEVVQTGGLVMA